MPDMPPSTPVATPSAGDGDSAPVDLRLLFEEDEEPPDTVVPLTLTPLQLATMIWQLNPPQPSLIIIAKGTFDLVADGPATLCEECNFPTGDMHYEDDFERSVYYPSDFAIFKPKTDVTLKGTAYPPKGSSKAVQARFRLGTKSKGFDRSVAIFGDRIWKGLAMTEPGRFEAIPLVYERAFGGPAIKRNPVGVGHRGRKGLDGVARLPNLEQPNELINSPNKSPEPACFAAIPMMWRNRYMNLGTYNKAWQRSRWPYYPKDFDYAYFQCAPEKQQLPYLKGDESYEVWGMHPELPSFAGTLPNLRVRCFGQQTERAGGSFNEINLKLDSCNFDLDEMKVDLVWRGMIEVSDDKASDYEAVYVTAEPLETQPASLAQAQEGYRATILELLALDEDLDDEPDPANIIDDELDEPQGLARTLRTARQQRAEDLRQALPFAGTGTTEPPLPPQPTPAEVAEKLRAAGASEADVQAAIAALDYVPEQTDIDDSGPLSRERVEQLLSQGAALNEYDLSYADLSELDLSQQNLSETVLLHADLRQAKLHGADLSSALLGYADLSNAELNGAVLDDADLEDAKLDHASLVGASLNGTNLSNVKAPGANFQQVIGEGPEFVEGHLDDAQFGGANIPEADFTGASLHRAVFDQASLDEVRLYATEAEAASFNGAQLAGARVNDAHLLHCNFENIEGTESSFDNAKLDRCTFVGSELSGASFVKARCHGTLFGACELAEGQFMEADLSGANLVGANLFEACLEEAILTEADLRKTNLYGASVWKATLKKTKLDGANVKNTMLKG